MFSSSSESSVLIGKLVIMYYLNKLLLLDCLERIHGPYFVHVDSLRNIHASRTHSIINIHERGGIIEMDAYLQCLLAVGGLIELSQYLTFAEP